MSKVIACACSTARFGADYARLAIVLGCAAALILADRALPF